MFRICREHLLITFDCDEFWVHFGRYLTNKLQCTDIFSKCGFFFCTPSYYNIPTLEQNAMHVVFIFAIVCLFPRFVFILDADWNVLKQCNECCKNAKILQLNIPNRRKSCKTESKMNSSVCLGVNRWKKKKKMSQPASLKPNVEDVFPVKNQLYCWY